MITDRLCVLDVIVRRRSEWKSFSCAVKVNEVIRMAENYEADLQFLGY